MSRQHAIEQVLFGAHVEHYPSLCVVRLNARQLFYVAAVVEHGRKDAVIRHHVRLCRISGDARSDVGNDRIVRGQRPQPIGQLRSDRLYRERAEHALDDRDERVSVHMRDVLDDDGHVVDAAHRLGELFGLGVAFVTRVEHDDVRLAYRGEFRRHAAFGVDIFGARRVGDASVAGHQDPDRRVIADHLARTRLRRLVKGHLFFAPRRIDHPRLAVAVRRRRRRDHISDAVDQPDVRLFAVAEIDRLAAVGDELGLSGHDRLSVRRLRQLVRDAFAAMFVLDVGDERKFGKLLDEGRLARPHGSDHSYIDVAARPLGDVLV